MKNPCRNRTGGICSPRLWEGSSLSGSHKLTLSRSSNGPENNKAPNLSGLCLLPAGQAKWLSGKHHFSLIRSKFVPSAHATGRGMTWIA